MKNSFVIRRVDDLGRIVIPKDLRTKLKIKTGDIIEINNYDNDSILMKKHNRINFNNSFVENLINLFVKFINGNIYLTDDNNIVFSNKKECVKEEIFNDLDKNMNSSNFTFNLTNNIKIKNPYKIYKLSPNGDFLGFLIYDYLDNDNNELYSNLLYDILKKFYEN